MHCNNVFQFSKIRTRKRNTKKSIKTVKNWNPALFGIRNPLCWNPESSTRNPESTAWNPESKNVLDSLTWGEIFLWWKYTQFSVYREGTENETDFTQIWIMWSLELVEAKPLLNRTKILWPYIIFYPKLPKKREKRKEYLKLIELK